MPPDIDVPAPPRRLPPIRTMRPLYVDRLPPCNGACPAGENVRAWLAEAQAGRYQHAWEINRPRQSPAGRSWAGLLSPV